MEVLSNIPFDIGAEALLADLRIGPVGERADAIREVVETIRPLVKPKAIYDAVYVENRQRDTVDISGVTFTSRVLRVNLDEAERVFPFIATCGREVHERAASYDDPMLRYCLDTIMANALRAASGYLHQCVKEKYALGQTSAMSPGSLEDWPLTQQRQLFSILGDVRGSIGVELTDSFLMVPIKSVSGIIFPTEIRFESCQLCPREGCRARRAAYNPKLWEERYGKSPPVGYSPAPE